MQRVTITIDDDLTAELERYMAMRGYANRPEAIRYLARAGLQQNSAQVCGPGQCVAALIYVYDHNQRELPKRLTRDFHDHHDLSQATIHVHLDHEQCMEVTVLKGCGVRHGKIVWSYMIMETQLIHTDTVRPAAKTDKSPLKHGSSKALEMRCYNVTTRRVERRRLVGSIRPTPFRAGENGLLHCRHGSVQLCRSQESIGFRAVADEPLSGT